MWIQALDKTAFKVTSVALGLFLFISCRSPNNPNLYNTDIEKMSFYLKLYLATARDIQDTTKVSAYTYIPKDGFFFIGRYDGDINKLTAVDYYRNTSKLKRAIIELHKLGVSGAVEYYNPSFVLFNYKKSYQEESEMEDYYLGIYDANLVKTVPFTARFKIVDKKGGIMLYRRVSHI